MTYTPLTWCASRQIRSTAVGLLLIGVTVCVLGYNNLIPITLNPGERSWELGVASFCSICLALLASINTLPSSPEWEQPLRSRTRAAHAFAWTLLIAVGSLGPVLAAVRLPHDVQGLYPSSIIAFYLTCAALAGITVHLWGRVNGSVTYIAIIGIVIALEQMMGDRTILADTKQRPTWTIVSVMLGAAILTAYKTAGHQRSRR